MTFLMFRYVNKTWNNTLDGFHLTSFFLGLVSFLPQWYWSLISRDYKTLPSLVRSNSERPMPIAQWAYVDKRNSEQLNLAWFEESHQPIRWFGETPEEFWVHCSPAKSIWTFFQSVVAALRQNKNKATSACRECRKALGGDQNELWTNLAAF